MGKRDIGKREVKKQKKDIKKPMVAAVPPPLTPQVEVIKKKRKYEGEESEEE
jgi:hypothetical protein